MDFLQTWGPYAPKLFSLWISIAYAVAYLRIRNQQDKNRASRLFIIAWLALIEILVGFHGVRENPNTIWWDSYYLYLCSPLILLALFHPTNRRDPTAAYPHPIDVLLFREPDSAESFQYLNDPESAWRSRLQSNTLIVIIVGLLAGISAIGVGLQSCEWLDISIARSGCLRSIEVDREGIQSIAFSPNRRLLAVAGSQATIQLYGIDDGSLKQTLRGHTSWVTSVAFSPDGALIASGSWDGTIRLWNSNTGTVARVISVPITPEHSTVHLAFSADSTMIASAVYETDTRIWRVSDGTLLRTIPATGSNVAFSPDNTLLAAVGADGTILLSRIQDGSTVQTLAGHGPNIVKLLFSPDGTTLASSSRSDDTIRLWRVSDGTLLQTLPSRANWDIVFSPDGQYVISGGLSNNINRFEGIVEIWEVATGQHLTHWQASQHSISNLAISPAGDVIASSTNYEMVRLWRAAP